MSSSPDLMEISEIYPYKPHSHMALTSRDPHLVLIAMYNTLSESDKTRYLGGFNALIRAWHYMAPEVQGARDGIWYMIREYTGRTFRPPRGLGGDDPAYHIHVQRYARLRDILGGALI